MTTEESLNLKRAAGSLECIRCDMESIRRSNISILSILNALLLASAIVGGLLGFVVFWILAGGAK